MKLKKMMAVLLAGATCAGMMAGCGSSGGDSKASSGSGENGTMTLIMSTRDEFLSTLESAAMSAAEEAGVTLTSGRTERLCKADSVHRDRSKRR